MTLDHIQSVAEYYCTLFRKNNIKAVNRNEELGTYFDGDVRFDPAFEHAHWMCQQLSRMTDFEKANRWLGFVQGVLWTGSFRSITQMREDNRTV